MGRLGIAAFAAGRDGVGTHARPELDYRDKAVAVGAVEALGRFRRVHFERGQRSVFSLTERHRNARRVVAEPGRDRRRNALEAIDLAPRHLPASEVALKLAESAVESRHL